MHHNSGKMYLEYFAKELLENVFPDEYSKISVADKPDLRMGSDYGIEVTWAAMGGQGQANGILNYCKGKNVDEVSERNKSSIEKCHANLTVNSGKIVGYKFIDNRNCISIKELLEAYENKKHKAIGYNCKCLDLLIFPPLAQIDGWLGRDLITEFFYCISEDQDNPFQHVLVYEEPMLYLCVLNVIGIEIKEKRTSQEVLDSCKKAADYYSGWSSCYSQEI